MFSFILLLFRFLIASSCFPNVFLCVDFPYFLFGRGVGPMSFFLPELWSQKEKKIGARKFGSLLRLLHDLSTISTTSILVLLRNYR